MTKMFCESVTKTKVSPFLYLNMFQSAQNLVHLFIFMQTVFFCKVLFLSILFYFFVFLGLSQFLRWNTDHVQIEFLWVLWGNWPIVRLFYDWVCCGKMCIFEISDFFYGFIGLYQFSGVKSRHQPFRFFVSMG